MATTTPRIHLTSARIAHHEAQGEWPVPGVSALLAERVARTPDRVFLVDGELRVTFAEFAARAEALAAGLRGLGIGAGDVVSWQLPSWLEAALVAVALDRLGCVQVPI